MDPQAERRCQILIGISMVVLTIGIGYCVIVGTCLAEFLIVIAGLFIGWVAFLYCLSKSSFWR